MLSNQSPFRVGEDFRLFTPSPDNFSGNTNESDIMEMRRHGKNLLLEMRQPEIFGYAETDFMNTPRIVAQGRVEGLDGLEAHLGG